SPQVKSAGNVVDAREVTSQGLVVVVHQPHFAARATTGKRPRSFARVQPKRVYRVVSEFVFCAAREAATRAEQHDQHQHAPGNTQRGQHRAQSIARKRGKDLLQRVGAGQRHYATLPSFMWITRSVRAAMSCSCVTITTVMPAWFTVRNRSISW